MESDRAPGVEDGTGGTLGRVKARILQWESGETRSLHRADLSTRTFRQSLYSDSSLRRPTTRDPRQKQPLLPPYRGEDHDFTTTSTSSTYTSPSSSGAAASSFPPLPPSHYHHHHHHPHHPQVPVSQAGEGERTGRGDFHGRRLRLASTGSVLRRTSQALSQPGLLEEVLEGHDSDYNLQHSSPLSIITDLDNIWKAAQAKGQGHSQGNGPGYLQGHDYLQNYGQDYSRSPNQSYLQIQGQSPNRSPNQSYLQIQGQSPNRSPNQSYLHGQSTIMRQDQGHVQGHDYDYHQSQDYLQGQNRNHFQSRDYYHQDQDQDYLQCQGYHQGQGLSQSSVVRLNDLLSDVKSCLEMMGDRDLKEQVKDTVSRDVLHFLKDWLFSQEDLLSPAEK
ncbi:uncharacterized protein LOC143286632 [Babylonia areolata]|uniref:uncharacterized protein LOC143286632 n=1 Tax=Babylonia areolata TaxID=304850 RepID=UPI003FD05EEC